MFHGGARDTNCWNRPTKRIDGQMCFTNDSGLVVGGCLQITGQYHLRRFNVIHSTCVMRPDWIRRIGFVSRISGQAVML